MTAGAGGPRRTSPSIKRVLADAITVQVVVLVVVGMVVGGAILGYRSLAEEVHRNEQTLVRLELLHSQVLSAETGLRGYALVGREEFLAPYREAFPVIDAELAALRAGLLGNDPRLGEIERLVDEWRDDFAEPILVALDEGDVAEADARFRTGAGKIRIDGIRARTAELAEELRDVVDARERAADIVGAGALVAVLVAVLAALALGYGLSRRLDRRVAQPMAHLAATADRFGAGDLSARASADGVLEVGRMSEAFNEMARSMEATVLDLRQLDQLKSEFVSVVSHELRTPLTSIRGSLGLLASGVFGDLPGDSRSMLAIAVNNTDRLIRLINDILDLERINSGSEALNIRPCSIGDLMVEATGAVEGAAHDAQVELVLHPVHAPLLADPDRVVQALTNLLGNAVKFSPPGRKVVVDGTIRPGEVVVSVTDEGRGIPHDKLEAVFGRFQQVDASDAREKGGTGLGLAIVRTIAEKLGGRVEVASEVGRGSTFSLILPLASSAITGVADGDASDDDTAPVVLIVEDDVDLAVVLQAVLERQGIRVFTAETAEEAVARCIERSPDLLVLDVWLSTGDGYEVVQRLRAHDRLRTLPTVVFTVHDLTPAERDRLRLGETVFLTKGPDPTEALEERVVDLLDRAPAARST